MDQSDAGSLGPRFTIGLGCFSLVFGAILFVALPDRTGGGIAFGSSALLAAICFFGAYINWKPIPKTELLPPERPAVFEEQMPVEKEPGIAIDVRTAQRFKRIGTPGYVLLKAHLIEIDSQPDSYSLRINPPLRRPFPNLTEATIFDLLTILEDYVVSYALDQCNFVSGDKLRMETIKRLHEFGATNSQMGELFSIITKGTVEAAKDLEQLRLAHC